MAVASVFSIANVVVLLLVLLFDEGGLAASGAASVVSCVACLVCGKAFDVSDTYFVFIGLLFILYIDN